MAIYLNDVSRTFGEYLLIPGLTTKDCVPSNVSLQTPLVKYKKGKEAAIRLNVPIVFGCHAVGVGPGAGYRAGTSRRHLLYIWLSAHRKSDGNGAEGEEV